MSDGYMSRHRDILPRIDVSLLKNKKTFKHASRVSFGMVKCLYLFEIAQLSKKFQFLARIVRW